MYKSNCVITDMCFRLGWCNDGIVKPKDVTYRAKLVNKTILNLDLRKRFLRNLLKKLSFLLFVGGVI